MLQGHADPAAPGLFVRGKAARRECGVLEMCLHPGLDAQAVEGKDDGVVLLVRRAWHATVLWYGPETLRNGRAPVDQTSPFAFAGLGFAAFDRFPCVGHAEVLVQRRPFPPLEGAAAEVVRTAAQEPRSSFWMLLPPGPDAFTRALDRWLSLLDLESDAEASTRRTLGAHPTIVTLSVDPARTT